MQLSPNYPVKGILYLLDDGYYLYRYPSEENWISKFLAPADVRAAFAQEEFDSGWLSPGLMLIGVNKEGPYYVYYHAACQHTIYLADYNGELKEIFIPIPPTVMVLRNRAMHIFAYQGGNIKPGGRVYRLPFPNATGNNGAICWGPNRPAAHQKYAEEGWRIFFDSPFSNHNTSGKVWNETKSKETSDCRELLVSLHGKKRFPMKRLIAMGTLRAVLGEMKIHV